MITDPVYAQSAVLTATVRPNPLDISLSAPPSVIVGQWFEISAEITNRGLESVGKTVVVLHSPSELAVKKKKQQLKTLAPHETETVRWRAKATKVGSGLVVVEVKGVLNGETITADETAIISSTSPLAFFWRRLFFGT